MIQKKSSMLPRDHEAAPAAKSRMRGQPRLHDELLVDEILTRLPTAAAARCRAVCRAWNAALTSEHFVLAHRARSAAARHPELFFFVPAAACGATSLYTCSLRDGEAAPSAARELLTVGDLGAERAVVSPRPCRGLTLVFDAHASRYYVFNLSTGEHVALPPCERTAATRSPVLMRIGVGGYRVPPWTPFELASAGLGFDPATGERKVVRLFKRPIGEMACEVCVPGGGSGAWRPCAGRVPAPAASFVAGLPPVSLGGSLYWLLELDSFTGADQPVMSFSVGAERFGWVPMPPSLARRVGNLAELDGSLCAVVDLRIDPGRYDLFIWSGASWSKRCSINLQNLPRAIGDEFVEEEVVIPLCSAGRKVLLATGRHKVFAYDPERGAMERVFSVQEFVDVPDGHREARLLLSIGLHEESLVGVHQRPPPPGKGLQVNW